jgi:hypothetical protein
MSRTILWRSCAFILLALSAAAGRTAAQDEPSVAEAARRARQQKQESAKPAKVITNDTLPAPPATPSESAAPVAQGDTSAPAGAAAPAGEAKKAAADSPEELEKKKEQIESLRKQIAFKQDEITTQQGEIALDQATYYSNPDYQLHTAEKAKIDGEKVALERMDAEMADLKAQLAELGVVIEPKPPAPKESITQNAPPPS